MGGWPGACGRRRLGWAGGSLAKAPWSQVTEARAFQEKLAAGAEALGGQACRKGLPG